MEKQNNSINAEIDLIASLSYMVANTDSIFFSIDREYRYTGFNKKHVAIMQKLYGKEPQIGCLISQIMSLSDWSTAKTNLDRALNGECFSVESYSGEENLDRRYFRVSHSPVLLKSGIIDGVIVMAQDLTKQHLAEKALRESEERYRIITENTVDTITVLDLDLNIVYVSPSVFKLRGYSADEAIRQRVEQIFTPSSLIQVKKLYTEQIEMESNPDADPKRTSELVLEEYCKDGSTIWVEIVFSFIRDTSLKATGIITVTRDITARRHSEQRIRQLAAIVESSDDAILSKTLDGRITSWNKGAEDIYGYSENEIIDKSIELLIPEGEKNDIPEILEKIRRGEHIDHFETIRKRKDGKLINVSLTISPMYDLNGKIIGASTIASDNSNRVKAEEILRESEIKYRTLIEKISAGVIVHRGDTSIEISNTMADQLLGLTHDQMLGKTIMDSNWDFVREDGTKMPPAEYPVCQVISQRNALRNAIIGIHRNDNSTCWALVNADPVFNRQQEIIQVIVTFIDISARREAEQALKQAHDELEVKVDQRTSELSLANHQLAALNKIGQVITAPLHLKDVLDSITFNTARLLGSDTGVILLLDESGEYLTIKGAYGLSNNVITGTRDRIGESIAGRVVQTGEPIIANNLMNDERFSNPSAQDEGLLSCASVPLKIDDRIIGTLDIHSKTNPEAFGSEHLHLMKMLASQAAIAIAKARLFEELTHAREELELKVLQRTSELFSMNEKLQEGISELKRTEKALWESSQMLRLVLNNMPAFVFWKDRNSVYLGCNYLFAENAGVSPEEIRGKTDFDLPWELTEAESYRSDDRMVMDSGIPKLNYEETQLTADGRKTWVRTSKIPLINPEGDIIGILGTFEDITEKRRVEHELQKSNELLTQINRSLRMLSNSNQVLIHTSDENVLLISICKNIVETGGYVHTWVGLTDPGNSDDLHSVIHVGDQLHSESIQIKKQDAGANPFQRSIRTKTPVLITDIKNDSEFGSFFRDEPDYGYKALVSLPLINQDEVLGVLVIYSTDSDAFNEKEFEILTELSDDLAFGISSSRSRAKKKLAEESLRLLSKALESAANSIVITDNKARIIWANQAFSYLSGYTLDEAIGKRPRDLVFSGVQNKEYYQKMWTTILEGQVWYGEIVNRRKDGSLYNEFLTITPVRDEKENISHFIAVKQDITDQKRSADELFIAKEKAEESNRLKSAFLATMNHELRTPLNHIIGFSDLIRSGTMLENISEYAEIIHRSSLNLLEIIESIFELAVAEQSEIKLRLQTIKCLDLFISNKSVLNEILEISGKRDQIELIYNADKDVLLQTITTDTNKINQVLINLFKNAVKFTHSGKIEFGLVTEKNGWLTFYVEDTGIGIPENKHKIIFEFFRQADDTHTREYGGVGIGLAISLKIAEVMHGSLSVESTPGKGSRFNFRIPALISAIGDSTEEDQEKLLFTPDFHGKKIIIAEDDPMSMELVKKYLISSYVTIIEAKNGKEVIENLDDNVNLILMDLNMPVMDGYMATKAIKQVKPDLPVLALTAYALSSDKTKAHEAGCDSIISKPVDRRILYEELKKYLLR